MAYKIKTVDECLKLFETCKTADDVRDVAATLGVDLARGSMLAGAAMMRGSASSLEAMEKIVFQHRQVWLDTFERLPEWQKKETGAGLFDGVCNQINAMPEAKRLELYKEALKAEAMCPGADLFKRA